MPGRTYEQSSEAGRERMLPVPYTRLTDQTPTLHDPIEVTSVVPGTAITGVSVALHALTATAIINVAKGTVTRQNVRNVVTYNPGVAELTWGPLNIGDPVWYDHSATMVALGLQLSRSPLGLDGVANTLFGHVVMLQDETAANFPKGAALVASTQECAVMHV